MPWQMAPPLIVVGGAFCLIGAGIGGLDHLQFGRVSETVIMFMYIFIITMNSNEYFL